MEAADEIGIRFRQLAERAVGERDRGVLAEKDGVRVVVDPSSAQLLTGAVLDYKDGLQQAGFSINNPNAQSTCGCGQSFS